jgi:hypothetical protein
MQVSPPFVGALKVVCLRVRFATSFSLATVTFRSIFMILLFKMLILFILIK